MLRLGIDIDGTVTAQDTFVPYLNQSFQCAITLEDMTEYDLTKLLKISNEEFWGWMDQQEPLIYKHAKPAEGAKNILNQMKEHHKLIYITARRKHLTDVTYTWFQEHQIHYDDIELVGGHHKLEAVQQHNIDVFFEDHHGNATMIAKEANIPVILFNSPYNQMPTDDRIIRVNHWKEADQWIKQYEKRLQTTY
ncbi:5' nucleotidase, NT5C type [Bacillus sp. 179-C3.3 HS]|uniref:5' nucleotidase, NT5C type n=1 Tax=Bacillus sp. 179-C3.3 HS TaxID=3232162 RepID=UPI00399FAA3C